MSDIALARGLSPAALAPLVRLRDLREGSARREWLARCAVVRERQERLRAREEGIAALQGSMRELRLWLRGVEPAEQLRLALLADARRRAIEHDLERETTIAIDERNALAQAERDAASARAAWERARLRREAVQGWFDRARRARLRQREARVETDLAMAKPVAEDSL